MKFKEDYQIVLNKNIDFFRKSSLWYGGWAATIRYRNWEYEIHAIGDVRASLYDEQGNELEYVKDKNNLGHFYDAMAHHIRNDDELWELERQERLVFDNNNWWEIWIYSPEGNFISAGLDAVLNADGIDDAIEEVIQCWVRDEEMQKWIQNENKEIISRKDAQNG